jgi:hypothetical protein
MRIKAGITLKILYSFLTDCKKSERVLPKVAKMLFISAALFFTLALGTSGFFSIFASYLEEFGIKVSAAEAAKLTSEIICHFFLAAINLLGKAHVSTVFFADAVCDTMYYFHSGEAHDSAEIQGDRKFCLRDLSTMNGHSLEISDKFLALEQASVHDSHRSIDNRAGIGPMMHTDACSQRFSDHHTQIHSAILQYDIDRDGDALKKASERTETLLKELATGAFQAVLTKPEGKHDLLRSYSREELKDMTKGRLIKHAVLLDVNEDTLAEATTAEDLIELILKRQDERQKMAAFTEKTLGTL